MKRKGLITLGEMSFVTAGLAFGLSSQININEVNAATLNYTGYDIEIRCTRPKGWDLSKGEDVYLHTWHDGSTDVSYKMSYLWQNEFEESVFSWNPSQSQPLFENMAFEVGNWKSQSSDLISPTSSGIYAFYDDGGWKSSSVSKMKVYLYDYDSAFSGVDTVYLHGTRDAATNLVFDSGNGIAMTKLNDESKGYIYSADVSNAVNRITFKNATGSISTGETSGSGANYAYYFGGGVNDWWNNINYVYAHNWAQNLLNFRNVSAEDGAGADGVTCESLYKDAKDVYQYFIENNTEALKEIKNEFPNGLLRMEAWAEHHHETFNVTDGIGAFSAKGELSGIASENNNAIIIVTIVASASVLLGAGFIVKRRKQEN